jgi:hypothetical protein
MTDIEKRFAALEATNAKLTAQIEELIRKQLPLPSAAMPEPRPTHRPRDWTEGMGMSREAMRDMVRVGNQTLRDVVADGRRRNPSRGA